MMPAGCARIGTGMQTDETIRFIHQLTAKSGEIIRPYFADVALQIDTKVDQSIVTAADREAERALRERIRSAVMSDEANVDARTCALLAIGEKTGFNAMLFTKDERKDRQGRIESLIAGDPAGDAVAAKIASIQAMVTTIVVIYAISSIA